MHIQLIFRNTVHADAMPLLWSDEQRSAVDAAQSAAEHVHTAARDAQTTTHAAVTIDPLRTLEQDAAESLQIIDSMRELENCGAQDILDLVACLSRCVSETQAPYARRHVAHFRTEIEHSVLGLLSAFAKK